MGIISFVRDLDRWKLMMVIVGRFANGYFS